MLRGKGAFERQRLGELRDAFGCFVEVDGALGGELAVGDCAGELGYVCREGVRWEGRREGRFEEWGYLEDDAVCAHDQ